MTPLPPSTLEKLSFLAGHWRSEGDGFVLEEMWLAPAGGVAQGSVRLVQGRTVGTIELIVVAAEADRVTMRYNHFDPDYRTWESDGPITLTLTSVSETEAVFTNLDAPIRDAAEMGYRCDSAEMLTSWVVAVDADGTLTRHSFDFQRVA